MKKQIRSSALTNYYQETDFSKMMTKSKKKKIFGVAKKRITMNISDEAYIDANELDRFMNMGYQNVLKTAIALGLSDLHKAIYDKKDISKILEIV